MSSYCASGSIDPDARVLICCDEACRSALSSNPTQVSEHLRRKHNIPSDERRQLTRLLRARNTPLLDPVDAPLREDRSPEDPNLQVLDGFACKFCSLRTVSSQTISRHEAAAHERQRLQLQVKPKAMYDPVYLQAWTKSPAGGRYWVVTHRGASIRPVGGHEVYDHLRGVFEREKSRRRASGDTGPMAAGAEGPSSTFTSLRPWLERTGWEQTYEAVNRDLLRNLTIAPSPGLSPPTGLLLGQGGSGAGYARLGGDVISPADDEWKIAALMAAVDTVMDRCEQTARTTSRSILCWLRSVRPHGCYAKPFTFVSTAASRKRYILLLKRFVAMVFRAYRLPSGVRRRAAGVRFKRVQLDLIAAIWDHRVWDVRGAATPSFWAAAARIFDIHSPHAGRDEEGRSESACSDDEEEDADDTDSTDTDDESESGKNGEEYGSGDKGRVREEETGSGEDEMDQTVDPGGEDVTLGGALELLELLFGLIMEFSTEEVSDGRPASTLLVYFSGVLGFSAEPTGFLPARAYTSYLAALIYVQRLLFLEYALPARGYPVLGIARRPRTGQVAQLQDIREKYMVLGSQSAFEELFSLLYYGRAVAGSDTPPFLLRWSDDGQSVSHGDSVTISIGQFRRLSEVLLEEASRLCAELMYGWNPPLDLTRVKDNMADTAHGFSFVTHPQNGLADAYTELSFRACTDQATPLSRNGRWDHKAVFAYLKKAEAFCEPSGGLLLTTGGGPPRSTELLDIRVRNHGSAERGFYIYNGSMFYLTRSHKAKRSTNREFIVARFLPIQVGHIIYKYLVYIRPFVDMLAREQNPSLIECSPYFFGAEESPTANPGILGVSLALSNASPAGPGARAPRCNSCGSSLSASPRNMSGRSVGPSTASMIAPMLQTLM